MNTPLISAFNPDKQPFPGMDDFAQFDVEGAKFKPVPDNEVIEHGRKAIQHIERPDEITVYRALGQSGLSKDQIEKGLGAILMAAGPRFMCVYDAMRLLGVQ